jgi:hypothetical protein
MITAQGQDQFMVLREILRERIKFVHELHRGEGQTCRSLHSNEAIIFTTQSSNDTFASQKKSRKKQSGLYSYKVDHSLDNTAIETLSRATKGVHQNAHLNQKENAVCPRGQEGDGRCYSPPTRFLGYHVDVLLALR